VLPMNFALGLKDGNGSKLLGMACREELAGLT
jgi:hypothetical protein